jgi:hypothetical protein
MLQAFLSSEGLDNMTARKALEAFRTYGWGRPRRSFQGIARDFLDKVDDAST